MSSRYVEQVAALATADDDTYRLHFNLCHLTGLLQMQSDPEPDAALVAECIENRLHAGYPPALTQYALTLFVRERAQWDDSFDSEQFIADVRRHLGLPGSTVDDYVGLVAVDRSAA